MLQVALRLLISSFILFFVINAKLLAVLPPKDLINLETGIYILAEGRNVVVSSEDQALVRDLGAGENRFRSRKMMVKLGNGAASGGTGKVEEEVAKGEPRDTSLLSVEEKNVSGFVAFDADYHGPRHHPPKNN